MSVKVKTKGPFETKAHRVISRAAGEVIVMPPEDYEEVKDLVEVLEPRKERTDGTGKGKISRNR